FRQPSSRAQVARSAHPIMERSAPQPPGPCSQPPAGACRRLAAPAGRSARGPAPGSWTAVCLLALTGACGTALAQSGPPPPLTFLPPSAVQGALPLAPGGGGGATGNGLSITLPVRMSD